MDSYVSFPALGWEIPVREWIFRIPVGDSYFYVRWYSVLIALGLLLAVWYAFRRADEFKINKDSMIDVVLVCAVFAILGARLYYVLFSDSRELYFAEPLSILRIWEGGLAIYGGIIAAFGTALWMCKLKKVDTLRMFDLAAPGFLIGQALGRWGNFFNQEAFGGNTTLPWGMSGSEIIENLDGLSYNPTLPVHPTFLYESLWCVLGLVLIHIVSKKAYTFRGQLFSLYIIWYGTGRFFIEQLRTDSLYLGTMRVSCLVAALAVIGGVVLYFLLKNREEHLPKELFAEEDAEKPAESAEENNEIAEAAEEETTDGSEN